MTKQPVVGIVMGSDSDLPVMVTAAEILTEFKIPHEVRVASAHRTPDRLHDYATTAVERGLRVIIAGAGGAAHLPGVIAAVTPLPVIGVPVKSKSLAGVDSLYSIVQMPPGIPVATVGINGAKNAGILAAEILGVGDETVRAAINKYKQQLASSVITKAERLEQLGPERYLRDMGHD